MVGLLRLLRPRQWIKNGFVFVGVLFAGHWNLGVFLQAVIGFCAFCCASCASTCTAAIFACAPVCNF